MNIRNLYKKEIGGSRAKQIHRPFKKNQVAKKEFRVIKAQYPYHSIQIDLADFNRYKSDNKNFRYLFLIEDIYSRYLWCYAVKTKEQSVLAKIFEEWLISQKHKVENVTSDREFNSTRFHNLAARYGFKQWYADILRTGNVSQGQKMRTGCIERLVRTLRGKIALHMTENNTKTFIHAVPQIVKEYNHTKHSAHLKTPYEVLTGRAEPEFKNERFVPHIKKGAIVRRLLARRKFAKEAEPYWSSELYRVVGRDLNRYVIENIQTGRREPRPYAVHQLMPVKPPPVTSRKVPPPTPATSRKRPPAPVTSRKGAPPPVTSRRSSRNRTSKYASLAGMG